MKIILGVTGSIAAYKAFDLMRLLLKNKHQIKVILTKGALKFVRAELFSYLGAENVYTAEDDFHHSGVLHIELSQWCDRLVIAPLSANTCANLSAGKAHDLLSTLFLAIPKHKPILLFPAMNPQMLEHPFTQENILALKKCRTLKNLFIAPTAFGELACRDTGFGKLLSVEEIFELVETIPENIDTLQTPKGNITITTGATIAPIDPVRYLTNSSSGLTGYFLAKKFLAAGYQVKLLAGESSTPAIKDLIHHPHLNLVEIKTADDMLKAALKEIDACDGLIASAAVNDFKFNACDEKIKKDQLSDNLSLIPAPDVLQTIIELKKSRVLKLIIVGFAAETDLSPSVLEKKMQKKPVDLLVGTRVNNGTLKQPLEGFHQSFAQYKLIDAQNNNCFEGQMEKDQLADYLLQWFQQKTEV